jgi:hypothetical protein
MNKVALNTTVCPSANSGENYQGQIDQTCTYPNRSIAGNLNANAMSPKKPLMSNNINKPP